ncbi:MAG: L-2-amino-thiazoline-4-carboxylic acid hydrolase [Candidatus Heimdallarchaeota archaeon]|nr:L-2-amino-thiazoline-4-carboxylic acid hydrolase [Candidatus Heimdallarchaeota archaeon]
MKIETCRFFNAEAKSKINLIEFLKSNFEQTDSVIKYFNKLKPNKLGKYLQGFQKRLKDEIRDFQCDIDLINFQTIEQNLTILNKYPELEKTISAFIWKLLELPEGLNTTEKEIEIRYFNVRKASSHLSYYRVKAIEDIFGKEEANQLYKKIVGYLIEEQKEQNPPEIHDNPRKVTRINSRERIMKQYRELGVGDFTIVIYDDFKELYKFDRCIVHEVLKEFNDPDIAYLSSCYNRDHPSSNEGHTIIMRKTQTLHHSNFCDELYWNNVVHPNAEQPTIEFIEKLSKEDPNKLIQEFESK